MNTKQRHTVKLGLLLLALGFGQPAVAQGDTDLVAGFVWSENVGWINFLSTNDGVVLTMTHLEGFVWSENVGWVKLGAEGAGPYSNTNAGDWGVNRDPDGDLSGFAWSENVGWIHFAPSDGGVSIDPGTGVFSGFAWSENVGWIHFRHPGYGVAPVFFADGFESGNASAWSNLVP